MLYYEYQFKPINFSDIRNNWNVISKKEFNAYKDVKGINFMTFNVLQMDNINGEFY